MWISSYSRSVLQKSPVETEGSLSKDTCQFLNFLEAVVTYLSQAVLEAAATRS